MARRFNVQPLTAGKIEERCDEAASFVFRARNHHVRGGDVAGAHWRARRLLLFWWAAGHDPERSLKRRAICKRCHGGAWVYNRNYDEDFQCPVCKGTKEAKL